MRSFIFAAITTVAAAALARPAAAQNIVTNGDFETPVIAALFQPVPAGAATLTGWQVSAPLPGQGIDIISAAFGNPEIAHHGIQALDMAGTPGPGTISQTLTTVPGGFYRIRFWLSSNGGPYTSSVRLVWDGQTVATFNSPVIGSWRRECRRVTAAAATSQIQWVGLLPGNAGAFLDEVSVEPTDFADCPGNVDDDCGVTLSDLSALLSNFGIPSGATPGDGDIDFDGDIDLTDLSLLLSNFGTGCED